MIEINTLHYTSELAGFIINPNTQTITVLGVNLIISIVVILIISAGKAISSIFINRT